MDQRSTAWDHFHVVMKNGKLRDECKHCGHDYAYLTSKNGGTSNMKKHMKVCKNHPDRINDNYAIRNFCNTGDSNSQIGRNGFKFDQKLVRGALAKMIIMDELPFRFVENEGFRQFVHVAVPHFLIPSRTTITRDCYKLYSEEKATMQKFFKETKQRVCLTTDTWTSNQNLNYLVLTGHFIDEEWKLRKLILNFFPCDIHKGPDMATLIETCLLDWGIENVFTITTYNASSNDTALSHLKDRLCEWIKAVCGGKFLQMRCLGHIINLVVKDGLKDIHVSVETIRTAVRYMKQPPSRWSKFKKYALGENLDTSKMLSLDCPTRWNSVYTMLETALTYQEIFHKYSIYEKDFRVEFSPVGKYDKMGLKLPNSNDWEVVGRMVRMLVQFYDITVRVFGSLYVTSNNMLEEISDIHALLREWKDDLDNHFSNMASEMRKKFDKYWGSPEKMNPLIFITATFDPRQKMTYVSSVNDDMYKGDLQVIMKDLVNKSLNELFEEYKRLYDLNTSFSQSSGVSIGNCSTTSSSDVEGKRKAIRKGKYRRIQITEGGNENESELELYLKEVVLKDEKMDLLEWWKINSPRFPILSRLARDILAIPITSVASEFAFSTGGRVISDFRSSLSPKIVQALICCQDWFRNQPIGEVEEDYEVMGKLEDDIISKPTLEQSEDA